MVNFDNKNLTKLFLRFALPSILGLLLVSFQVIIDGIFVSVAVGPLGLAAINLSLPLINIVMSVALMIICGGVVIAGIARGNGDEILSRGYTSLAFLVFTTTMLSLSMLILLNLDFFINILGADEELRPFVKDYLSVMIGGAFFYCFPIFTEGFARLINRPKLVLLSGFVSVALNVILDYIFVIRMDLGLRGAGFATFTASGCAALALLPFLKFGKIKGTWIEVRRIFFNGSSEMLTSISSAVTTYVFNLVLLKYIGTLGVSALTIVMYINILMNFTIFGLAQALQPLVAYNIGARRINVIKRLLFISLSIGCVAGVSVYLTVLIFKNQIIGVFTNENIELFELTKTAATYITIHYLFSFGNIILGSFHTAIERPIESAVIGLCRSIIFVLIPLLILPKFLGNIGIWISPAIAEVLCLSLSIPLTYYSLKRLYVTWV